MKERILPLQDSIERARKLTAQLLDLARIQTGTTETTTVDVLIISRQLISEYLPLSEAKGIDLPGTTSRLLELSVRSGRKIRPTTPQRAAW